MKIQEEEEEDRLQLTNTILKKNHIVGIDEVGRGSLFGPVFAGAVILDNCNSINLIKSGLKDSKKLTAKKREVLVPLIKEKCLDWGLGQASAKEIDQLGIRLATEKAMLRALEKLKEPPELIFVDGLLPIRLWQGKQKTIVRGEDSFSSIAAASIISKVERDNLIKRLAIKFPGYELEKNVGYGTASHLKSIKMHGATKLHRLSFLSRILSG